MAADTLAKMIELETTSKSATKNGPALLDHPSQPMLDLQPGPMSWREWLASLWDHRSVQLVLARQDFQVRFKRASLGVAWAVLVPAIQAAVMIIVFSHFVQTRGGVPYGPFVLSGILGWTYFSSTLSVSVNAIVVGATLTDKVWFPRALLPIVPCLSGLVGLGISMVILIVFAPILGAEIGLRILLLIPAVSLLVTFTIALSLVLSALQVYFRDVRFMVLAAMSVWIYATPIMYPQSKVGHLGPWLDFNPMTGIMSLFHLAIVGDYDPWSRGVIVSVVVTVALLIVGIEVHRRRDRLFVDLL
jgi:lipopolysaccharide transport system permease protein